MSTRNWPLFEAPLQHMPQERSNAYAYKYGHKLPWATETDPETPSSGQRAPSKHSAMPIYASTGPDLLNNSQVTAAVKQNRDFERYLWNGLRTPIERLFHDISAAGLWNTIQPVSGPYNFRNVRGRRSLSMHAFGIAIDIKPDTFPKGQNRSFPDARIVQIFQDYGFHWGIFFPTPDPMHFQFATGA